MTSHICACRILTAVAVSLFAAPSIAQQIFVEAPATNATDSFYENFGVNFGFSLGGGRGNGSRVVGLLPNGQINPFGNIIFTQNGSASAIPPFGGYDPNADGQFGYGIITPGGGGYTLGIALGSGDTRSVSNVTPGVMVQNGFGGSINSGALRPFVTGVIPVVANGNENHPLVIDNGVTRAQLNSGQLDLSSLGQNTEQEVLTSSGSAYSPSMSTAERGAPSVESLKAARVAEIARAENEMKKLLKKIAQSEERADYKTARSDLRTAIKQCTDAVQKKQLRQHLTLLRGK